MINNMLDIFICAYKQFDKPVKNSIYKTLSVGNNTELYGDDVIRDDSNDNISDMNGFFSELTGYYWVWKNYKIKDYVGFCHYRRYFSFLDNIPNSIDKCDIILPVPLKASISIYDAYSIYHNSKDLDCIKDILIKNYNIHEDVINDVYYKQTYFFSNNIFIMKKELFDDYCSLLFGVLFDYLKINKLNDMDDVKDMISNNKELYLKNFYPNNTIEYQSRLGGFFAERILNIWLKTKTELNISICAITETEQKYKAIKDKDFL